VSPLSEPAQLVCWDWAFPLWGEGVRCTEDFGPPWRAPIMRDVGFSAGELAL
jgi:hypothetical protein